MLKMLKKYGLVVGLAVATFNFATGAEARDRGRHHDGGDAAAIVGASIVRLAIGALIAGRDNDHYDDRRYYNNRRHLSIVGYPDNYYYYAGYPNRYYRDHYYGRSYGHSSGNRWDRG